MDLEMTPWGHREQAQEEAAVFQRLSCMVWDQWGCWAELQQGGLPGERGRVWI